MHEAGTDDLIGFLIDCHKPLAGIKIGVNIKDDRRRQVVSLEDLFTSNRQVILIRRVKDQPRHFVAICRLHVTQLESAHQFSSAS